jgi:hypothetical protein
MVHSRFMALSVSMVHFVPLELSFVMVHSFSMALSIRMVHSNLDGALYINGSLSRLETI